MSPGIGALSTGGLSATNASRTFRPRRLSEYQNLFAAYRKRGINRNLNPNDKELIDRSDGQIRHYYSVGADATRVIINALLANSRQPPQSILDFPSGSGRVTRHLRAFSPRRGSSR